MQILITGGAGFIGSALIRWMIRHTEHQIINVDKLTYAASLDALRIVETHPRYRFAQADICDVQRMARLFAQYRPDAVIHLAAESHVDRSIDAPAAFMQSNIIGTYTLLEATRRYYEQISAEQKVGFRFLHVSTDEVYGDVVGNHVLSREDSAYAPSSPYSASKASADHLVRA